MLGLGLLKFAVMVSQASFGAEPIAPNNCLWKQVLRVGDFSVISRKSSIYKTLPEAEASKPSKQYLIPGDLVYRVNDAILNEFGKRVIGTNFRCIVFRSSRNKLVSGFVNKDDLKELSKHGQPSKIVIDLIKDNAGKAWPHKTFYPERNAEMELDSKGTTYRGRILVKSDSEAPASIAEIEFEPLILSNGLILLRDSGKDQCGGYAITRFNNALLVSDLSDGRMCWGNHGQSNPEGAYFE